MMHSEETMIHFPPNTHRSSTSTLSFGVEDGIADVVPGLRSKIYNVVFALMAFLLSISNNVFHRPKQSSHPFLFAPAVPFSICSIFNI